MKVGYNYLSKKHNNKLILNTNKVSLDKHEEIESLAWYYDEPITANSVLLDQLCNIMKKKDLKLFFQEKDQMKFFMDAISLFEQIKDLIN